jgi:hypothetical protein
MEMVLATWIGMFDVMSEREFRKRLSVLRE